MNNAAIQSLIIVTIVGGQWCIVSNILESVKHFLIDCKLYEQARVQLFTKLEGLLELRVSKYTKTNLCDILLFGEKPHLYDKYIHNKHIFFAVQRFLGQTKRCKFLEENKPPANQADPLNLNQYPQNTQSP